MHYLLDTSAIVKYYCAGTELQKFLEEINNEKNVIHILEICNPEVISVFYKKHYGQLPQLQKITLDEVISLKNQFINDIKLKMKFLIHLVMARDIMETDKIWEAAEKIYNRELKNTGKDFMDSTDALVLGLAINLSKTKGIKDDFALITDDTHLYLTAKQMGIKVMHTNEFK